MAVPCSPCQLGQRGHLPNGEAGPAARPRGGSTTRSIHRRVPADLELKGPRRLLRSLPNTRGPCARACNLEAHMYHRTQNRLPAVVQGMAMSRSPQLVPGARQIHSADQSACIIPTNIPASRALLQPRVVAHRGAAGRRRPQQWAACGHAAQVPPVQASLAPAAWAWTCPWSVRGAW